MQQDPFFKKLKKTKKTTQILLEQQGENKRENKGRL